MALPPLGMADEAMLLIFDIAVFLVIFGVVVMGQNSANSKMHAAKLLKSFLSPKEIREKTFQGVEKVTLMS